MDDFFIRLAAKEDIEEVLCLMRACFGERASFTRKWYEWFNYASPIGFNRNYVAIDTDTNKFVGGYGLLPIRITVNGKIDQGSLCTNVMTHPDYQGKGLFVIMGRYCLDAESKYESRLTLGVPNENAYPGHMKVGWMHLSDLVFIAKFSFQCKSFKSQEVSVFDARLDEVNYRIAEQANFMVVKDHRFLNWRYPQRPDRPYRLFVFENKRNIDGYMVLKYFDDNGYRKTHILDIMACSEEAFGDLIFAAERCALGRDELNCWQIRHSVYEQLFANYGFTPISQKNTLIMHTNYGQEIRPEPTNWWFALGDNDVY